MDKSPLHPGVYKNDKVIGYASDLHRIEGACSDGSVPGGLRRIPTHKNLDQIREAQEPLPDLGSIEADFGFGQDLAVGPRNGTTVFPSVGLYELIDRLNDAQKDGLIESLGGGRWVKLDTLKKAIDKMEHPGPR